MSTQQTFCPLSRIFEVARHETVQRAHRPLSGMRMNKPRRFEILPVSYPSETR
jgi:hypothetical protein